jgi:tetratricopeptide (TPR) repeat protein
MFRPLAALAASLFFFLPVEAQRPSADLESSPVRLDMTVVYANEQTLSVPVRVRLVYLANMATVEERFTDSAGRITFGSVLPGKYSANVTGAGILDAAENIEVQPHKTTHSIIHVRPAEKIDSSKGPGGTVTLTDLNIPEKARKEFDSGAEAMDHGDSAGAVKHFERAAKIYPNFASAFNNLGVIAAQQKHFDAARTYFEKAVSLNDHLPDAYLNLRKLDLNQQKFQDAKQPLAKVLAMEPDNVGALLMMANCELITGQNESAIAYARKIHQLPHEKFAASHLVAARALEASHHPDQAVEEYRIFLQEAPSSEFADAAQVALTRLQSAK